jgi:hypothetical protein
MRSSAAAQPAQERARWELARELGLAQTDALPALAPLEAQEIQALVAALRAAKAEQQRQLGRALHNALAHVPAALRGPLRKMLERHDG